MSLVRTSLATIFLSLAFQAWADLPTDPANLSLTQFHFKHQSFTVGSQYSNEHIWRDNNAIFVDNNNVSVLSGRLEQYDATISYPFKPRELINLDLGINLRFIAADLVSGEADQAVYNLNTALPMFYANAMFGLPYEGLSASLGASHFEYDHYYALDYKAKLSYQWQNGFGMAGGWQHQEFSIEGNDFQADIENKGLFLDFKYNF